MRRSRQEVFVEEWHTRSTNATPRAIMFPGASLVVAEVAQSELSVKGSRAVCPQPRNGGESEAVGDANTCSVGGIECRRERG